MSFLTTLHHYNNVARVTKVQYIFYIINKSYDYPPRRLNATSARFQYDCR